MFSWNFLTFTLLFFGVGEAWGLFTSHSPNSQQQVQHPQPSSDLHVHTIPFLGGDKK